MNLDVQLLGADTAAWAQRLAIVKLYDLGKFLFGAGTATVGFLFTAEKLSNPLGQWDLNLKVGFSLLVLAMMLSIGMVIAAAPHLKNMAAKPVNNGTTWSVVLWFVLWTGGTALGVRAVVPF